MKKILVLLVILLLLIGLVAGMFAISSPYFVMSPGDILPIDQLVQIPSLPPEQQMKGGHFYLTSVSISEASLAQWFAAHFDPTSDLVPRENLIPHGVSPEDVGRLELQQMDESKTIAKVVALQHAGYNVVVSGAGARVEGILPESLAKDKLMVGDVIVGFEGQSIQTSEQLMSLVSQKQVGDTVHLTIERDSDTQEVDIQTISSPSTPGRTAIGILISTYLFDYNLPFEININTGDIGGPSAGLMFSLGILNDLLPQDITQGYLIAGTGTIAEDGTVGPIDGAKQKVIGAERVGAQYFLVPVENFDEAQRAAQKMKVVSVHTFDDALDFLKQLATNPDTAGSSYAPYPQLQATPVPSR